MTDFEGFVPVPGGRIWAQAAGNGPGVVLVHAGIADARMWDPQWDALAAEHRVVRYETRGFGRTETDDVEFSDRADLVAVMDAVGVDRAVVVGCSRGGSIELDAAIEYPDRFDGLVWVCGGLSGLEIADTPEMLALGEREEALYEARDWAGQADLDIEIWVDGIGQPAGRAPESVRRLVRQMCLDTSLQEKVEGRPIPLDPPAVGRLGEIRCAVAGHRGRAGPALGRDRRRRPGRGGRRRTPDRCPGRRPPAEPRAARVVHRDAAGVPGRDRLTLTRRLPVRRPARDGPSSTPG